MKDYILVIDAGTTSMKALIYDRELRLCVSVIEKAHSLYPAPRQVEQDPQALFSLAVKVGRAAIARLGISAADIACAAITNQRASWLMWDDKGPLCNLITWQDTRGADKVRALIESLHGKGVKWGNVDAWLLHQLTGGAAFATSYGTASNSMLLDMKSGQWDLAMLEYFGLCGGMLPEIKEENARFGVIAAEHFGAEIPVMAMAADQQAAMFAQGCFSPNVAKCTNGSGTFLNVNIGEKYKTYGDFFTSIAWKLNGKISYMFEGSSFTTGSSLEWAQKQLELFGDVEQLNRDAASVDDSGGVYFVPALGGLHIPYNDQTARASFMGIGPAANRRHFARAVLESVAYAAADLVKSFQALGVEIEKLSVSGGVSNSDIVVELMANLLGFEITRPESVEATGFGAAALAAINMGWIALEDLRHGTQTNAVFTPNENAPRDAERFAMWKKAVERSLGWLE